MPLDDQTRELIERIVEEVCRRRDARLETWLIGYLSEFEFRMGASLTINYTTNNSTWANYGVITGDVTIQGTLEKMSTQEGTAEITKVFAEMLKALQDSKEIGAYDRRAVVAAAEDLAKEAAKPPAQRDGSTLKTAWEYLTGAIGAVKGAGEIASNWGKWSEAIKGFFASSGGPPPFV